MGKSHGTKVSSKQKGSKNKETNVIWVDPSRIRFQHARIRSSFSSCGRTIEDTLEEIRSGQTTAIDIPPIQVLINPLHEDWYFTLNNRRLYVFKKCLEEGLLTSTKNTIPVRVRKPKSSSELTRYTIENCSLHASIMDDSSNKKKIRDQSCPKAFARCNIRSSDFNDALLVRKSEDIAFVPTHSFIPTNFESDESSSESESAAQSSQNRFGVLQR